LLERRLSDFLDRGQVRAVRVDDERRVDEIAWHEAVERLRVQHLVRHRHRRHEALISSCLTVTDLRAASIATTCPCSVKVRSSDFEAHDVTDTAATDASSAPSSRDVKLRMNLLYRCHSRMIWIGTSGYNYPEWKGSFYPADLPAAKMLPYYAARFPTVE